jgi:hypothetical protein
VKLHGLLETNRKLAKDYNNPFYEYMEGTLSTILAVIKEEEKKVL